MIHYLPTLHAPTAACGDRTSQLATRDPGRVTCPHCLHAQHQHGMPEATLLQQVRALAREAGYALWYHTHRSDHSPAGFPDVILVRPEPGRGAVYAIECKTRTGKVRVEQRMWLEALEGKTVHSRLVRPADLAALERDLRGES